MAKELDLLERAIRIAVKAHKGAKDSYGAPYILHPLRVMHRVSTTAEKIVAILHDVVEDTSWTLDDLRKEGFPEKIIRAVDRVSKREGEDYWAYIRRAGGNSLARRVKLADLEDNMDVRRRETLGEKDIARLSKYLKAWKALTKE